MKLVRSKSALLPPRTIGLAPTWLFVLLFVLAYLATAMLARELVGAGPLATIWPPAAVAFVAFLLCGWWLLPIIAVCDVVAMKLTGLPILPLALLGSVLAPAAGAVLYRRIVSSAPLPQQLKESGRLLLVVLPIIAAVTTLTGVGALRMAGLLERFTTPLLVTSWWMGDLLGLIVFTPILMALAVRLCGLNGGIFHTRRRGQVWERWAVPALSLCALAATWQPTLMEGLGAPIDLPGIHVVPILLVLFMLMLWSALRLSSLTTFIVLPVLVIAGLRVGLASLAPLDSVAVIAQWLALLPTLIVMSMTTLLLEAGDRDRDQYEKRLHFQSGHDPLTGLLNRRAFAEEARDRLGREDGTPWLLGYMDLDQFQSINDTLGHGTGDEMLAELTESIRTVIEPGDCLARLGGDEFGLIVHGSWEGTGERRLRALHEQVGRFRFQRSGQSFSTRSTIGVTPLTGDPEDYERLLGTADTACIAAKESGGNRILFTDGPDRVYRRLAEMRQIPVIQQAIDHDRVELFGQPFFRLDASESEQMIEVFCRLRSEEGYLLMPEAFIPVAERFGLMPALDRLVVGHALKWLSECTNPPKRCFINLSAASVSDPLFIDFLIDALDEGAVDTSRLGFEITETAAIQHYQTASGLIDRLRSLGCLIALDDFGTGMSSFGHLQQLDVDIVKIDGRFVRDLTQRPINEAIVRSIAELGRSTGILTVAEWVESAEVVAIIKRIGVDYAQGYHFGRPTPLQ